MLQLLAIDAGGTSTRAMLIEADGTCLGVGRAGRGNPVSDGAAKAAAAIVAATAGALRAAERTGTGVAAVTLAMAGGLAFTHTDWLTPGLLELGVDAPVAPAPDLLAMFCSGTAELDGYGLVAGTGATAVRVRGGQMATMADGLGWLLGDSGSGFWIGHQVARAVALDLESRGPATTLTAALLAQLGIAETSETVETRPAALNGLVRAVYSGSPLQMAAFAPLALADPDDAVSRRIVDDAVAYLARAVLDVADPDLDGPLVIGGGVGAQPRIRDALLPLLADGGLAGPALLVEDGLVGAGVLALRRHGVDVDETVFDRLSRTTALMRSRTTSPAAPA